MKSNRTYFRSILLAVFALIAINTFSQYETVQINGQEWMAKNLTVKTFRNGDPIQEAKTEKEWIKAAQSKQPAWCYYLNSSSNGDVYGIMYNWFTITDPRELAPEGWRIPGDADFAKLMTFYQNDSKLIYAVMANGGKAGLNIPIGGWRGSKAGDFKDIETYTAVWSVTEKGKWASYFEMNASFFSAGMREAGKGAGCYVRCIK